MIADALRLKFVADLEKLFDLALQKENFSVALKAKELLGRERGYFRPTPKSTFSFPRNLQELTDEELAALLSFLSENASQDGPIDKL